MRNSVGFRQVAVECEYALLFKPKAEAESLGSALEKIKHHTLPEVTESYLSSLSI